MNVSPIHHPVSDAREESEEWFLGQLERDELPVERLLGHLRRLARQGAGTQADTRGRMLQEMLQERGLVGQALEVMLLRAGWVPVDESGRRTMREEALALVGGDRRGRDAVAEAGFDKDLPPVECVRRLGVLAGLEEGGLCYDKTWGFGVVRRFDDFQKRVEIDFEQRRGHQMSFAYAAETLRLLEEDHLLARRHRDPAGMARLAEGDPAEVVRLALRSFGPLPVALLQEQLVPRVVAPGGWKKFWDAARKELKKDPLVDLPAKRTEPLALREREEDFGAAWFARLAAERDLDTLLARVRELLASGRAGDLDDASLAVLGDRLAFLVRGAEGRRPGLVAQAVMEAERCKVSSERVDPAARAADLSHPALLCKAIGQLPAREVRGFLGFMLDHLGEPFLDRLLEVADRLEIGGLTEAVELLAGAGREAAAADRLRELANWPDGHIQALLWLHRQPDRAAAWELVSPWDLWRFALAAMERDAAGERLKAQNQLRDRFGRAEQIGAVFEGLTREQRKEAVLRLRDSSAWPPIERQAVLARLVRQYPDVEDLLRGGSTAPAAAAPQRITSVRSYRERQAQLARLVGEEIPANSREIGVARSYGDLRENFEYKAAKEMQTILMRRQAEWEQQLQDVHATDFAHAPTAAAGPGTLVTIAFADGSRERYCILGAWDRDEAHGIISSESGLARAVTGCRPGDRVTLPADGQGREGTVDSIDPLPEAVRRWASGGEGGAPTA